MATLPDCDHLAALTGLFYDDPAQLGQFAEVTANRLPPAYRQLLAHEHHMTVAVEAFHGGPVDVRVLNTRMDGDLYARKILLCRQRDAQVVQFGIMRLGFAHVDPEVRREVESQQAPLGRILIRHNVLRVIRLLKLWRVTLGPELAALFGLPPGTVTYGRTAVIDCNGQPAVELLEIVTPVGGDK